MTQELDVEIDVQLLRLLHLRDVVFPLAERARERGLLRLNNFREETSCGTAHCLLGWGVTTQQLHDDGWYFTGLLGLPAWRNLQDFEAAQFYYGLTVDDATALFGTRACGGLETRKSLLNWMIQERSSG